MWQLELNLTSCFWFITYLSFLVLLEHLAAKKWVYWYLNGTLDLSLMYHGNWINGDLIGFANLDWAGDLNSQRSVTRYTFMFCGAVISWSAKKQPTIALSSTKAECMAMTHAGKEAIFLEHLHKMWTFPFWSLFFYGSIISLPLPLWKIPFFTHA